MAHEDEGAVRLPDLCLRRRWRHAEAGVQVDAGELARARVPASTVSVQLDGSRVRGGTYRYAPLRARCPASFARTSSFALVSLSATFGSRLRVFLSVFHIWRALRSADLRRAEPASSATARACLLSGQRARVGCPSSHNHRRDASTRCASLGDPPSACSRCLRRPPPGRAPCAQRGSPGCRPHDLARRGKDYRPDAGVHLLRLRTRQQHRMYSLATQSREGEGPIKRRVLTTLSRRLDADQHVSRDLGDSYALVSVSPAVPQPSFASSSVPPVLCLCRQTYFAARHRASAAAAPD